MKKQFIAITILAILFTSIISSCNKKSDPPTPDEQELITTLKIQVIEEFSSFVQTFEYKVENGFGGAGGTVKIDTIKLKPDTKYDAVLTVLNEKATPTEDLTNEIIEESNAHLFLKKSEPASGNGSISVGQGNKDKAGNPLNQTFKLTSGTSGKGSFRLVLLHQPTNKNATSVETAGGETDLDAIFPVLIQ
ncbi:MAG: hypothetical protein V4561_04485 [Bacteroidota bacterium]